jgi:hypothetical protein
MIGLFIGCMIELLGVVQLYKSWHCASSSLFHLCSSVILPWPEYILPQDYLSEFSKVDILYAVGA